MKKVKSTSVPVTDDKVKTFKTAAEAVPAMNDLLKKFPKNKHFILSFHSLHAGGFQVSLHENGDMK